MSRARERAPRPEWAVLSVDYFDDPDVAELSDALQLAHLRLILFTTRAQIDGRVDSTIAKLARVTARQLHELEGAQLVVGGKLKGWHKWQKPRAEWEAEHASRVYAGKLGNCQRWHELDCRCLAGDPPKRKPGGGKT